MSQGDVNIKASDLTDSDAQTLQCPSECTLDCNSVTSCDLDETCDDFSPYTHNLIVWNMEKPVSICSWKGSWNSRFPIVHVKQVVPSVHITKCPPPLSHGRENQFSATCPRWDVRNDMWARDDGMSQVDINIEPSDLTDSDAQTLQCPSECTLDCNSVTSCDLDETCDDFSPYTHNLIVWNMEKPVSICSWKGSWNSRYPIVHVKQVVPSVHVTKCPPPLSHGRENHFSATPPWCFRTRCSPLQNKTDTPSYTKCCSYAICK